MKSSDFLFVKKFNVVVGINSLIAALLVPSPGVSSKFNSATSYILVTVPEHRYPNLPFLILAMTLLSFSGSL